MVKYNKKSLDLWKYLSWETCSYNLYRLQNRMFKSLVLGDIRTVLQVQKLIMRSNSARFLAIREVTQVNVDKKISGIDGKISLTFTERFELNEYLRLNANNWKPQVLKMIPNLRKDGTTKFLKVATIADRTWQCLIIFMLEPLYQAQVRPYICGVSSPYSYFELQKFLFINLNVKAHGIQKRVLEVNLTGCFHSINLGLLMHKAIAPRGVKLGLYRTLQIGFTPEFSKDIFLSRLGLNSLLSDIALNGIESIHPCIRYADTVIFILKPLDSGKVIVEKLNSFLINIGLDISCKKVKFLSSLMGFNFLGWHFRVFSNGNFRCTPSVENYKTFKRKIKHIVNNSNYGSFIKATKLSPIVKNWRFYHKFCNMEGSRNSLFYMQRRAFKVFNKEAKQDRYSSKKLLDKAFPTLRKFDEEIFKTILESSSYHGHLKLKINSTDGHFSQGRDKFLLRVQNHRCIHCGVM
uniref:Ycf13 n=1 Tax=Eutreptiella pomquetensis TaxID=215699 RepID=A0A223FLW4_9EUGL|nr:ycf13 [Eutreptiella pomquetensis]